MYYLVTVDPNPGKGHTAEAANLQLDELIHRVVVPYAQGNLITLDGTTIQPRDIGKVKIFAKEDKYDVNDPMLSFPIMRGRDVTDEFITGPPGGTSEPEHLPNRDIQPTTNARGLFVVHGRNLAARDALFEFLRSLDLHPLDWSEAVQATDKPMPYIGEILDAAFSKAHAVVVLLTPDDEARLKESLRDENDPPHETELSGQARPNVLFEAGMAMGRSQDRTILVELGALRPFSDIAGRHVIRLDNSSQRRQELAQRLQTAGCPVKLDGTGWHTSGDFDAALERMDIMPSEPMPTDGYHSAMSTDLDMSSEAKCLLVEAAEDNNRSILKLKPMNGLRISTNGKEFVESGNKRSSATWEGALNELIERGLVEDQLGKGQAFVVTREGFNVADILADATEC